MSIATGMQYLDIGIGIALFAGMCWWIYTLTSKSHARRASERRVKLTTARQPWGNDKVGGRGNR